MAEQELVSLPPRLCPATGVEHDTGDSSGSKVRFGVYTSPPRADAGLELVGTRPMVPPLIPHSRNDSSCSTQPVTISTAHSQPSACPSILD